MSNSTVPAKGDIIINPATQRPIKVGGRSWLKLVKEGVVSGHYTDPKKLGKLPNNPEEAEKEIERINKTLPKGVQSVRGRGKYKGQITTRNKRPDTEDVSRYTAQMASRIVNDNIESLADCDDIEAELEKLILQEMAGPATLEGGRPKKKVGRPRKTSTTEEKYVLEEAPQYDEPEDHEDESFFGDGDIDYFGDE
jgi:hypothetical protein